MKALWITLLAGCLSTAIFAAGMDDELQFRELPPEPEPAPRDEEETPQPEPDITIIQREDATIVEYRINGHLRAVRIIPVRGKPYYLVDTNGDGQFDVRTDDLADNMLVPRWVIHSW